MGRKMLMPGTHKKHLTKEEIATKTESADRLAEFTPLNFKKVPRELTAVEKKEWKRLAEDLQGLPLSELDRNALAAYCGWWSVYLEAKKERDELGVIVEEERKDYTIRKKNPAIELMATASKEIKSIASEIGLTVNGRLQIVTSYNDADDIDDDDDFAKI